MPTTKEFTIVLEDRPGTLGKTCRALADRSVNILAFQSFQSGIQSTVRMIVDNSATTKSVLDAQRLTYTETEVLQVKLPHRPGELARTAARLGEANINIHYAYCGLEPGTNTPLLFLGVKEVAQAAKILEQASAGSGA